MSSDPDEKEKHRKRRQGQRKQRDKFLQEEALRKDKERKRFWEQEIGRFNRRQEDEAEKRYRKYGIYEDDK